MVRPQKFGEASKKIGIILPLPTLQKLDDLAGLRGGDRSLTIAELIDNAALTTQLTPPKPKKEMSKIEKLIYETEMRRGKPLSQCKDGLYVRGQKIDSL